MKVTYVLDTNVILYNVQVLNAFEDNEVVIPMTVIEELDKIKTKQDVSGANARQAIRLINELGQKGSLAKGVKLNNSSTPHKCGILRVDSSEGSDFEDFDMTVPDNRILNLARLLMREEKQSVIFMTLDQTLRLKANAVGIPVGDFKFVQAYLDKICSGSQTTPVCSCQNDYKSKGRKQMKHLFYDVTLKKMIYVEILEAVKYGKGVNTRFAFKGQTEDGRSVTCFVKKEEWDKYIQKEQHSRTCILRCCSGSPR